MTVKEANLDKPLEMVICPQCEGEGFLSSGFLGLYICPTCHGSSEIFGNPPDDETENE